MQKNEWVNPAICIVVMVSTMTLFSVFAKQTMYDQSPKTYLLRNH